MDTGIIRGGITHINPIYSPELFTPLDPLLKFILHSSLLPLAFVDSVESTPIATLQTQLAVDMKLIRSLECELVHTGSTKWVAPLYCQLHTSTCKSSGLTQMLACNVDAVRGGGEGRMPGG